ncbi:MAG: hypothetical protein IJW92_04595 [Clostridia bacterium]|nr:hypothetical protein [Clostridia bacterium]
MKKPRQAATSATMTRHILRALPLLLLTAALLCSCIHYVPREQDRETTDHSQQTTVTETPTETESTTRPTEVTTGPIEETGFPNEAEPNGTKRY